MDILLLFGLFFAGTLGGNCFAKLSSNRLGGKKEEFPLFFTVNGGIACLFFLCSGGFKLQLDGATAGFSLLYAGVVVLALYSNLKALQKLSIAYLSIVGSAGILLINSLLGLICFSESFDLLTAARIALMLAASALIFSERRGKRPQKGFLLPLALYVAAGVGNYMVLKLYTMVPHQASDSSFFFYTNLILVLGAVAWLLVRRQKFNLSLRGVIPFAANTFCANTVSLVSLALIARTEAVFYNPVSSAIATLCVILASLFFKEKLGARSFAAAGLALISVVI